MKQSGRTRWYELRICVARSPSTTAGDKSGGGGEEPSQTKSSGPDWMVGRAVAQAGVDGAGVLREVGRCGMRVQLPSAENCQPW